MAVINPGFRGFAQIDGTDQYLRFNTCSLNAVQAIEAPDMVMGDQTHDAWAYGKIEVGGTISGPCTESVGPFIETLDQAIDTGVQIDVKYYDGYFRAFTGCRLNSYTFNVSAGEVIQYSLEIIGLTRSDTDPSASMPASGLTFGEKLVTWDKASFRLGTLTNDDDASWSGGAIYQSLNFEQGLQSFTFTASNNITRQFVLGASDLFGNLVKGMKSVTGSISSYVLKSSDGIGSGANFWMAYLGNQAFPIRFDIGNGIYVTAAVRFHRGTSELGVGPVVTAIGFTGVTTNGYGNIVLP